MAPAQQRIAIIGGGITGLSAAHALQETVREQNKPASLYLIEAGERLGGKIVSDHIDGLTIEGGPDCFIRQKPWAAQLAGQIGLRSDIIGTNDEKRKTFVVVNGKLVPLPDGVMLIVPTRIMPFALSPLITIPGKLRMGMDLIIKPFRGEGDESIAAFVRRRLGNEALDKIAEPLLSGIHVSDPEEQSLLATFPRFRALEKNHGSMIMGMLRQRRQAAHSPKKNSNVPQTIFLSFREGMAQLTRQLEDSLVQVEKLIAQPATRIERRPQGTYTIHFDNRAPLEVDALILAVPANHAVPLVKDLSADLAGLLEKIRFVSTATVSMAFRKSQIQRSLSGFGVVIPRKENRDISACTWTSNKFNHRATDDTFLLRCFVGGPRKEEMVACSDEEIIAVVRREIKSLVGLDADPVLCRIYRWEKSHPQYDVGHLPLVESIHQACGHIPGFYLAGSSYEGVGIPDCIRQGQQAAASLFEFLQQKNGSAN